ncbi:protein SHORT HYPOCOTYL IN WHITE LIGHT 1 [Carica papaya]|uniref:protein SHORT HYPOCOTYL IN WHITE LIGHT 1 n=1 Tax=Carica papaya TaxID=3649 RepID=UPI000B8CEF00|nr:protein SHORT HYPOCOTYL IN WHITE LIGHT 1 [Carica papaya]
MSFTVTFSLPSISSSPQGQSKILKQLLGLSNPSFRSFLLKRQPSHIQSPFPLFASRKTTSNISQRNNDLVDDPRSWSHSIAPDYHEDDEDEDVDDDEEEDRSLDLLVRFVQNVFKKISKRARRAARSVLPPSISTKLVGFTVNGVLILAFLWVLKAFLEVVCTLGSIVFVSILLIRGIWTGITYLQESRNYRSNEFNDEHHAWSRAQPVP